MLAAFALVWVSGAVAGRTDRAARLAPVSRRQRRRPRRHGAHDRRQGKGGERRARDPGLSRRVAVQGRAAVERDDQRPARHHAAPAGLCERPGARIQRDADARPGAQLRSRQAPQRLAVHEGHPRAHRAGRRHRAVRCLVRRRDGLEARLHPRAQRRQGTEVPRGGSHLRADVADGWRIDRVDSVERNLQRLPDRRCRGHGHQHGELPVVQALRAGEVHDRSGQERPVVHVRAGADVEDRASTSSTRSSSRS